MTKRPDWLLFGREDRPPATTLAVLGGQHYLLALTLLVYPVVVSQAVGLSPEDGRRFLISTMIAVGLGTILQSQTTRFGSGMLIVQIPSPVVMGTFIAAAAAGGLGLACGMVVFMGLARMALSFALPRLRALFPPEVCGVCIALLGVSLAGPGMGRFTGVDGTGHFAPHAVLVASLALAAIVGVSVWATGQLKLFALVIGCAVGYVASIATGLLNASHWEEIARLPFFSVPTPALPPLSFDPALAVPFLLIGLINSLNMVAGIVTTDKMEDEGWVRADMRRIGGGVFADGATATLSGLLGGLGTGVSTTNIGLAHATGATARRIGLVCGALLLATAFLPEIAMAVVIMPRPVVGAILVYAAAFLITSGMKLILSRMLDTRRTFVVGFSFILGVSVVSLPQLYAAVPELLRPLVESPITVGGLAAIVLNLVLRLGVHRRETLEVPPEAPLVSTVQGFMDRVGGAWGARPGVVARAASAIIEAAEEVSGQAGVRPPLAVAVGFDEFTMDVEISYRGQPIGLSPDRREARQLLEDDADLDGLAAFLITRLADRVRSGHRDGVTTLRLHFDH